MKMISNNFPKSKKLELNHLRIKNPEHFNRMILIDKILRFKNIKMLKNYTILISLYIRIDIKFMTVQINTIYTSVFKSIRDAITCTIYVYFIRFLFTLVSS